MRPTLTLAFVLALRTAAAVAGELPEDLAQAVNDYDRATIHSDVAMLTRIFADDYIQVNSDATVEDKRQALADFLMPGFKIDPYAVEQPLRIVREGTAVIGGVIRLGWSQDGAHHQRRVRIVHTWSRSRGSWQMLYTQVTFAEPVPQR